MADEPNTVPTTETTQEQPTTQVDQVEAETTETGPDMSDPGLQAVERAAKAYKGRDEGPDDSGTEPEPEPTPKPAPAPKKRGRPRKKKVVEGALPSEAPAPPEGEPKQINAVDESSHDEPAVKADPKPEPTEPVFDEGLLGAAGRVMGLSPEQAKSFGSPDALRARVAQVLHAMGQRQQPSPQVAQAPVQQPVAPPLPVPVPQPAPPAVDNGGLQLDLPPELMDGDLYSPEQVAMAKGVKAIGDTLQQMRAEQTEMRSHFAAQKEMVLRQRAEEFTREFDVCVAELPDQYSDSFGKGSFSELPEGGPQRQERVGLMQLGNQLIQNAATLGQQLSMRDAVQYGAALKCGAKNQQETEAGVTAKIAATLKEQAEQFLLPPGQSGLPPELSSNDKAIAEIRTKYPYWDEGE